MIVAGKVAADTLVYLSQLIQPGIPTKELDLKAKKFIESQNCSPAFLNYKKYPNSICTSVNEEVVHCLPSERILKDGDIITLDLGVNYQGLFSDTACTYFVGNVKPEIKQFVQVGYNALIEGIRKAKPGNFIGDISAAIENVVKQNNYGVVRNFVGHGIGRNIHEAPQIPNYVQKNSGPLLVENMVVCIEPILTMDPSGEIQSNGWNTKTKYGSLACHFEHEVWIKSDEPKILTKRSDETFNII